MREMPISFSVHISVRERFQIFPEEEGVEFSQANQGNQGEAGDAFGEDTQAGRVLV